MTAKREFLLYHALALAAVCCQATSATMLRYFPNHVPPSLKMAWRLWWMGLLQLPLAYLEWRRLTSAERASFARNLPPLLMLAPILALNYVLYAIAVDSTSLLHAFLLSSTINLQMVCATCAGVLLLKGRGGGGGGAQGGEGLRAGLTARDAAAEDAAGLAEWAGVVSTLDMPPTAPLEAPPPPPPPPPSPAPPAEAPHPALTLRALFFGAGALAPPSALEVLGTLVGFAASAVIISESVAGAAAAGAPAGAAARAVTAGGDVAALACASAAAAFLVLFARVRAGGVPPFCAMVPLNLAASALLAGGAPLCCGAGSLLGGSFESPLVAGLIAAQVLVPGIGGWGLMLLSLRRVTPLTMATLQLLQTPIGSGLGAALGTLAEPTPTALAAGAFVLAGAALVVAGGARRAK